VAVPQSGETRGVFCSTSGTWFADKESLQAHYRSDFHRYNLKRRAVGLPPVSADWFAARRAQLAAAAAERASAGSGSRVWVCPLSKKRFATEGTWEAWRASAKCARLARAAGLAGPPEADVRDVPRTRAGGSGEGEAGPSGRAAGGASVNKPGTRPLRAAFVAAAGRDAGSGLGNDDDSSGWETVSDDGAADEDAAAAAGKLGSNCSDDSDGESPRADWDPRRCLFCDAEGESLEANLAHMWGVHSFFLPSMERLRDPAGLVRYLGLKMSVGGLPLASRGDDPDARQFRSLEAVRAHMRDARGGMAVRWEDNWDEYDDFYDWDSDDDDHDAGKELTRRVDDVGLGQGGYELRVRSTDPATGTTTTRVVGHRDLLRYHKQHRRQVDERASAQAREAAITAYRALGLETGRGRPTAELARIERSVRVAQGRHETFMGATKKGENFTRKRGKLPRGENAGFMRGMQLLSAA